MLPRGAYAPVPTPLDDRFEFDACGPAVSSHLAGRHRVLTERWSSGPTASSPRFRLAERLQVAEAAAASDSGLRLMLGVGSCSLVEVLEMVAAAAVFDYDVSLVPTAILFSSGPDRGFRSFLREVLDHAKLPVLLYHIPQVTGVPISEELLDAIDGHPRLAGVKDSSGDPAELARLSERFSDRVYMVGYRPPRDGLLTRGWQRQHQRCSERRAGSGRAGASRRGGAAATRRRARSARGLRSRSIRQGDPPSRGLGEYATRPPLVGLDTSREDELWAAFCELVPAMCRP